MNQAIDKTVANTFYLLWVIFFFFFYDISCSQPNSIVSIRHIICQVRLILDLNLTALGLWVIFGHRHWHPIHGPHRIITIIFTSITLASTLWPELLALHFSIYGIGRKIDGNMAIKFHGLHISSFCRMPVNRSNSCCCISWMSMGLNNHTQDRHNSPKLVLP